MKNQGKMFFMVMVLALAFLSGCETPYTAPTQTETSKNLVVAQQANLPAPSADNSGALYYVLEDAKFYYSNGSAWVEINLTGTQGLPGSTGSPGSTGLQGEPGLNGISITWFGSLATPMASPELNWAYYNTNLGISYIWDGSAWQILAQDGTPGATGPQGEQGATGPMGPQGPAGEAGVSFILYTSDTTITASQSPFYVGNNLIVAAGATLTIEAGVDMVFFPGAQFIVEGNLVVSGASGNIVRFRPYTSVSINQIQFGLNATSNITYAEFERVGLVFYNGAGTTNQVADTKFIQSSDITSFFPIMVANHTDLHLNRVSSVNTGASAFNFVFMTKGNLSGSDVLISGSLGSAAISGSGQVTATLSAVQFSQSSVGNISWSSTGNLSITASNFDESTVRFLSNSSGKTVNFTNNYFGGLTGAAVTAKILNSGTGSATDTSGIVTTPYIVSGCGW